MPQSPPSTKSDAGQPDAAGGTGGLTMAD